jgi:hypothetical protein
MRRLFLLLLAIAMVGFSTLGCGNGGVTSPRGTGTVRVSLTDAPAAYDSIVLNVREVTVHRDGPDNEGWFTVATPETLVDLLLLRNGVFTNLGSAMVPSGHYTQMRLILDSGSYIVVDLVRHDLFVPSGLQTGLKLVGGFDVPDGGLVDVGIDFDAARSVHVTGNGRYMLKPTARVHVLATTGSITGVVSPANPASNVSAVAGADTVASTVSGEAGAFTLALLPAGLYDVHIDAPGGFRDTTIAGVSVTAGQAHDIGVVTLSPQ